MIAPEGRQAEAPKLLALAPYRRDGEVLRSALTDAGYDLTVCETPAALLTALGEETGLLLLTQESLTNSLLDSLWAWLAEQPAWSELPILLLLDTDRQTMEVLDHLRASLTRSKLSVLARPVTIVELLSAVDVALKSRRWQWQVRGQMEQEVELRRELNHRVKNAFANIYAVYHMTRRRSGNLEQFEADFEGRLSALSRVHDLQFSSDGGAAALELLCESVLSPYRSDAAAEVTLEGPAVSLRPQAATTLALCLHELATNAVKYGALSVPGGRLALSWTVAGTELDFNWSEAGGPPLLEVPTRKGYGTGFIRAAVRSGLNGEGIFDFRPGGLRFSLRMPVQHLVSAL